MNRVLRRAAVGMVAVSLLVICALPTVSMANSGGRVEVVPIDQKAYGRTYGQWSAKWWQWVYSLPITHHPLFNNTGGCDVGQTGKVWFLGGTYSVTGANGTADRFCTVPSGKALFFPIFNDEWDNICPPQNPPANVEQLRGQAAANLMGATVSAEIDGKSVEDLIAFRATSPVFSVQLPANNIWQSSCNTQPGRYGPLVADGWYLFLRPLSPGQHIIHFIGAVPSFTLDITYHLTVAKT